MEKSFPDLGSIFHFFIGSHSISASIGSMQTVMRYLVPSTCEELRKPLFRSGGWNSYYPAEFKIQINEMEAFGTDSLCWYYSANAIF
jgi:hypothetical protein